MFWLPVSKKQVPRSRRRFVPRFEALEQRCMLAALMHTPEDQLIVELINRARQDPAAEAALYQTSLGSNSPDPKPPLAPNSSLMTAAGSHSDDMLTYDYFSHTGQGGSTPSSRAWAAGYPQPAGGWDNVGENIGWGGSTGPLNEEAQVYERHRRLFLSPGHQANILNSWYREIGVGMRFGQYTVGGTTYNASMLTESFGNRVDSLYFITGVTFDDSVVADDFFTLGEQLPGVTITAVNQSTQATYVEETGPSGAYSIRVPNGTYQVTASGGGFGTAVTLHDVVVSDDNVKVDFVPGAAVNVPPVAADDWAAVPQNGSTTIDVAANDSDTDGSLVPASVTMTAAPNHGQATINSSSGEVTYVPDPGFVGMDTIRYTVADDQAAISNEAIVRFYVNPTAASIHTNPMIYVDVDGDLEVKPMDVLVLVNYINTHGAGIPSGVSGGPTYVDVTGDGLTTALDVIMVINFINRFAVDTAVESLTADANEFNAESDSEGDLPYDSLLLAPLDAIDEQLL